MDAIFKVNCEDIGERENGHFAIIFVISLSVAAYRRSTLYQGETCCVLLNALTPRHRENAIFWQRTIIFCQHKIPRPPNPNKPF